MILSKPLLKIILINLILSFVGIEAISRCYYFYRYKLKEPLLINKYPEMRNYLKFVNHYRDKEFRDVFLESDQKAKNKLKPINKKDDSFFIYSKYSICKNKDNCKTILLQGDSVGEGLGINATDILFSKAVKNGWQTLHGGTTSFSPKNFSGQLAYFDTKDMRPDILITYIDQFCSNAP